MKYIIILLLFAVNANAQNGIDIIHASAKKISNLKTISYTINSENAYEKVSADVSIKRGGNFPVFETSLVRLQGIIMSDKGSSQISMAYNGTSFSFWDNKNKEQVKLDSPTYSKLGRTGVMFYSMLILAPYWQKEPFGIMLQQIKSADIVKDTVIFGTSCFQIRVVFESKSEVAGTQLLESTWFIGVKDYLIYGMQSKLEKKFLKITDVDKPLSEADFTVLQSVKTITGTEPIGDGLLSPGTVAPNWSLPAEQGTISLESLKGKVVLLDFWGTWCMPCIKAMPHIQAIYNKFKGQPVEVIGVSVEMEKGADPLAFMRKKGYSYPVVLNGHTITEAYKVQQFPSVYIIDKRGVIIHAEYGGNRENFEADIIDRINKALK